MLQEYRVVSPYWVHVKIQITEGDLRQGSKGDNTWKTKNDVVQGQI
jgi:hypothetical protein